MTRHLAIVWEAAIVWKVALACLFLVAPGCGGSAKSAGGDAQTRAAFKVLGLQYSEYLAQHNGAAPPDEAAMREFLESQLQRQELSVYNVKSVDDLLKAGRDNEPVAVVCGAKVVSPEPPKYAWAAYERTGVNGNRLACDVRGGVFEFTAEEFAAQIPIKK